MLKVALIGIGRMGKLIVNRVSAEKGLEIVAVVESPESDSLGKDAGTLAGIEALGVEVTHCEELGSILEKTKPDVVVDFTNADACSGNAKTVAEARVNMVVGTTGFSDEQARELEKVIKDNGVGAVISPNMSVGVNVFWNLVKNATEMLGEGYDIEIVEAHHRFKKDAPSGTALKTAEIICKTLGVSLDKVAVYGRKGICPRKEGEIGISVIRAGDIVGEHTVLYSTEGERIEVTHKAHSRSAFVNGVVKAIRFIDGKKGIYTMKDVLKL